MNTLAATSSIITSAFANIGYALSRFFFTIALCITFVFALYGLSTLNTGVIKISCITGVVAYAFCAFAKVCNGAR